MAAFALHAARAGQRSEEQIAMALCAGFWRGAPVPRIWTALGSMQKEPFRICARRVIAVGRELRQRRTAPGPEAEQMLA